MKYYISNNIMFLGGNGKMVSSPSCAIHYKSSGLPKTAKSSKELKPVKLFNNKNHKDYGLSTPMRFLGKNNSIVDNMRSAISFSSIDIAKTYAERNNIFSLIPDAVVIGSDYRKINIAENNAPTETINTPIQVEKTCVASTTQPEPVVQVQIQKNDSPTTLSPCKRIRFSPAVRERVYNKYNGICQICGKPVNKNLASIDHIVPLYKGGTNDESNLQLTHDFCNKMKGSYTEEEHAQFNADMISHYILNNPDIDIINKLARSIVRGINRKTMMI